MVEIGTSATDEVKKLAWMLYQYDTRNSADQRDFWDELAITTQEHYIGSAKILLGGHMNKILVIARSQGHYQNFLESYGFSQQTHCYVSEENKLRGVRPSEIIILSGAELRDDYRKLEKLARIFVAYSPSTRLTFKKF